MPPKTLSSTRSTSLQSMAIAAMSRVSRRRPPFASSWMFSFAFEPLKRRMSAPPCPSTISLPSPGSQLNVSSFAPMSAVSLPWLPSIVSLPSPPRMTSAPLLPAIVSSPAPASIVIAVSAARLPVALATSLPSFRVSTRASSFNAENSVVDGAVTSTSVPFAVTTSESGPAVPTASAVSVPATPPSSRSWIAVFAADTFARSRSLPPCPATMKRSFASSAPARGTATVVKPSLACRKIALPDASNVSAAAPPLNVTVSAAPSPRPPAAARLNTTCVTSVPCNGFTVRLSAPPSAFISTRSTSLQSITMFATSRVNSRRPPFACRLMFSVMFAPLKRSVSASAWPSTISLPSPGSQLNTSSPAPISATSLPWLPSIVSLPASPISVSANAEPRSVSSPPAPFTETPVTAGNTPTLTPVSDRSFAPGPPTTLTCVIDAHGATPVPGFAPFTCTLPPTQAIAIASAPSLVAASVVPVTDDVTVAVAGIATSNRATTSVRAMLTIPAPDRRASPLR